MIGIPILQPVVLRIATSATGGMPPAPGSNFNILTEASDNLITEAGDALIQEAGP